MDATISCLGFRFIRDIAPTRENRMQQQMETEIETTMRLGVLGSR